MSDARTGLSSSRKITTQTAKPLLKTSKQRVLVIAHGHPDLNKGGGEIAAYNLFKALNKSENYEALFMAHQDAKRSNHGTTPFSTRQENEILFHSDQFDFFKFSQGNKRFLWHNFKELLEHFKPDIVHFHHYLHIGLEAIRIIKNTNPNTKIVLTLHEFLAICHNSGQMVTTNQKLCHQATPSDCHQCFPDISPKTFFLREQYIKSFFSLVDQFIAPSQFLKDRYVNWGIAKNKITVLENGQLPLEPTHQTPDTPNQNRFAYFGQLTQFKGLDVLLEAIALLPKNSRKKIHLDIHGSNLDIQPQAFQDKILKLLKKLSKQVTYHGSYDPHELPLLMKETDWVIVPSSWWENSPLVIQEAFKFSKPVICSDIGGMAEKVTNGIDGLHFRTGKANSLSNLLTKITLDETLHTQLVTSIKQPISYLKSAEEHNKLYKTL